MDKGQLLDDLPMLLQGTMNRSLQIEIAFCIGHFAFPAEGSLRGLLVYELVTRAAKTLALSQGTILSQFFWQRTARQP